LNKKKKAQLEKEKQKEDKIKRRELREANRENEQEKLAEQDRLRREKYGNIIEEEEEEEDAAKNKQNNNNLECLVCKRSFKSEKQYENHEQSVKHKKKC